MVTISKFWTVAIFVIVHIQTRVRTEFVDVFVMYLRPSFTYLAPMIYWLAPSNRKLIVYFMQLPCYWYFKRSFIFFSVTY